MDYERRFRKRSRECAHRIQVESCSNNYEQKHKEAYHEKIGFQLAPHRSSLFLSNAETPAAPTSTCQFILSSDSDRSSGGYIGRWDLSSQILNGSASLQAAHHEALCQTLVLHGDPSGERIPAFFRTPAIPLENGNPLAPLRCFSLISLPPSSSYAVCNVRIGWPTAARIISFVQPAQHL